MGWNELEWVGMNQNGLVMLILIEISTGLEWVGMS